MKKDNPTVQKKHRKKREGNLSLEDQLPVPRRFEINRAIKRHGSCFSDRSYRLLTKLLDLPSIQPGSFQEKLLQQLIENYLALEFTKDSKQETKI